MFTRKPQLPLAAGLFGKKTHSEDPAWCKADNDEGAAPEPDQDELNRRSVAFTTRPKGDLAA